MTDTGLFGPGSMAWALCGERAVATMIPRVLLLQHAHPTFAAAAPSGPDRYERAVHTLREMVFGDQATAKAHAVRVAQVHARLPGWDAVTHEDRAWVLITLLDGVLRGAELARGRLPDSDATRFLVEGRRFGRLFGVRPADVPVERATFDARVDEVVRTTLVVGPQARAMYALLLERAGRWRPWMARWVGATVPERIARELGASGRLLRPLLSVLPYRVRRRAINSATHAAVASALVAR